MELEKGLSRGSITPQTMPALAFNKRIPCAQKNDQGTLEMFMCVYLYVHAVTLRGIGLVRSGYLAPQPSYLAP